MSRGFVPVGIWYGSRGDSISIEKELIEYPVKSLAKTIAKRVIHVLRGGASFLNIYYACAIPPHQGRKA